MYIYARKEKREEGREKEGLKKEGTVTTYEG